MLAKHVAVEHTLSSEAHLMDLMGIEPIFIRGIKTFYLKVCCYTKDLVDHCVLFPLVLKYLLICPHLNKMP